MRGQIFISYRREDSGWVAGRLRDRLQRDFDAEKFFMDIDAKAIPLGANFKQVIEKNVDKCDVLIAVIAKNWLGATDDDGGRRLDNPEDFVRLEIGTALKREICVIPVLVDGVRMPQPMDLPEDLRSLVWLSALSITAGTHFDVDCQRLVDAIRLVLEKAATGEQERPVRTLTPSAQPEADKPSAEPLGVVHPLPLRPSEPEGVKPPPPSSGGTGDKSPSKQVIAFLASAAVLVVAGIIYLTIRESSSTQHTLIATVTRSAPPIATPTVEKTPLAPRVATEEEMVRRALDKATRDHPWVNRLGMKFVPVAGTQVLFSVWDTRVQEFERFVAETNYDATGDMESLGKDGWEQREATWKEPGFSQGPTHPVVGVNWNDAKKFCEWLTMGAHGSGMLPRERVYRLPTDAEWSAAVGLQGEEGNYPKEKDRKIKLYPWGKEWPPPKGAGNYAGEEAKNGDWPAGWPVIEGYNDGYLRTSPVGSFAANANGLCDMGGNVWQWCEDWYDASDKYRVVRGGAWYNSDRGFLLASCRVSRIPSVRGAALGFRCVIAVESSQ